MAIIRFLLLSCTSWVDFDSSEANKTHTPHDVKSSNNEQASLTEHQRASNINELDWWCLIGNTYCCKQLMANIAHLNIQFNFF